MQGDLPRGDLQGGAVCPGGGMYTSPLWTEFLTQACENITFPQLRLRTVKMKPKFSVILHLVPREGNNNSTDQKQ